MPKKHLKKNLKKTHIQNTDSKKLRKTGIDILGDCPWGTHFCQFYHSQNDLIDMLVPYFKAGLENNEFCMWVTSEPLGVEDAKKVMQKAVPNFDKYLRKRQIEIVPYTEWYVKDNTFNLQRVLNSWVEKLNHALVKGYDGMRVTGNTFWFEKRDWKRFTDYEEEINNVIGKYQMMAICTYSLDKCNVYEIIDVVKNHQFAIIKREGKWEIIESSERKRAEEALRESEERLRAIFETAQDSIFIKDRTFRYIQVNSAMERLFKLPASELLGKTDEELFAKEAAAYIRKTDSRVLGGKIVEEEAIKAVNGVPFVFHVIKVPIRDNSGKIIGLCGIARDITERKKAEKFLKESQEKIKNILESSPDSISVTDLNGNITECNEQTLKMHGFSSKEEVIGKSAFMFIAEKYHKRAMDNLKKVLKCGTVKNMEYTLLTKDGKEFPGELSASVIKDNSGKPVAFVAVTKDITERKETEEALRESEGKFRILSEQNMLGIIIIQDGLVKFVNQAACVITEYSHEEVFNWVPGSFSKLFHPDELEFVMKQAQKKQKGEKDVVTHYSYRIVTKSGKVIWVDQYSKTISFEGRNADFITILDITERKRAEEALRESEERFRTIFETAQDSIFIKDRTGRYIHVNPGMERLFRIPCSELIGKTDKELFGEEEAVKIRGEDSRVFSGEIIEEEEAKLVKEIPYTFNVIKVPMRDSSGDIIGLCGIARDVTERKRAEEQIKQSLREKEVLLKEIHHRVKNNMQIISSLLNLQSRYIKGKKVLEMFQNSQARIRAMALVHERLYRSQDLARINFVEYVQDLVRQLFMSYGISTTKIKFNIRIKDVFLNINKAIPCSLIINELVSNSLKHAFPEGKKGKIDIDFYLGKDNKLLLKIRDNGIGLSDKIDFKNTKTLGLQLVTTLVEQLNGTIEVDIKRGTTFKIKFDKSEGE
jgi:PAS domain S-box-containing protein